MNGLGLPRDSMPQSENRVAHTGIYLGRGDFIHCDIFKSVG